MIADDVEERDTEKYEVEECEEDNKEEEMVTVRTMVAATTNNNTPVSGFFCICLPRKFMGLKAKVCFTGIWVWGLVRIWVWGMFFAGD